MDIILNAKIDVNCLENLNENNFHYNNCGCNDCFKSGEFLSIRNTFNKGLKDKNLITNYNIIKPPSFEPNLNVNTILEKKIKLLVMSKMGYTLMILTSSF